jgi:hypothetical protein
MAWFAQLCRNAGLMIHHVIKPVETPGRTRREIRRSVEEERISPTTTLRRTVIEEVEVRGEPSQPD